MTHNPDACKSVFVTWVWLAGIMAAICVGAIPVYRVYAEEQARQTAAIAEIERKIDRLEMINVKIDTLLKWGREKQ